MQKQKVTAEKRERVKEREREDRERECDRESGAPLCISAGAVVATNKGYRQCGQKWCRSKYKQLRGDRQGVGDLGHPCLLPRCTFGTLRVGPTSKKLCMEAVMRCTAGGSEHWFLGCDAAMGPSEMMDAVS